MITDVVSFGAALQKRRKEPGYAQAFLSDFRGFSVSFISEGDKLALFIILMNN